MAKIDSSISRLIDGIEGSKSRGEQENKKAGLDSMGERFDFLSAHFRGAGFFRGVLFTKCVMPYFG